MKTKKAGWLTQLKGPIKENPKQTSLKRYIVPHWAVPPGESPELPCLSVPSPLCLWDGTFQKHRKFRGGACGAESLQLQTNLFFTEKKAHDWWVFSQIFDRDGNWDNNGPNEAFSLWKVVLGTFGGNAVSAVPLFFFFKHGNKRHFYFLSCCFKAISRKIIIQ